MKTIIVTAIITAFIFLALKLIGGTIKGKVMPADGASQIWAMSSNDTLKAAISQGAFEISNVKQGTYKIYIDAVDPYKDVVKDGVQVPEGGIVDLGEIQLTK